MELLVLVGLIIALLVLTLRYGFGIFSLIAIVPTAYLAFDSGTDGLMRYFYIVLIIVLIYFAFFYNKTER